MPLKELSSSQLQWPVPEFEHAIVICKFLTIRIDVTRYVKARSHINFQIKTLEKISNQSKQGSNYILSLSEKTNIRKQNWIIFQKTDSFLNSKSLKLNRDIGRFFVEIGWSGEILEIGSLPTKSGVSRRNRESWQVCNLHFCLFVFC